MKHTLLIITALLFFSSTAIPQTKMNINNLVEYGDKKYKPNDDEPYTGRVFDLYEDGQKKLKGSYKDGLRNRKWTFWYENGQKMGEKTYKNGIKIEETWWEEDDRKYVPENKVDLQYRFSKNDSFKQSIMIDQEISQTILDERQDMIQKFGIGYNFIVTDVGRHGNATIDLVYESVLFNQYGTMGNIEYDSSNPPESIPDVVKGFSALIGMGFTMVLSPKGKVLDIKGADKMLTEMLKSLDLPTGSVGESIEKSMKDQFGDQALKEMMQNMMPLYPEEPIGIGDSWIQKIDLSKGFAMNIINNFNLKHIHDGIAIIDVHSTISSNANAPPMEIGPMKMHYLISGTQEGTMKVLIENGMIIDSNINQDFSGQVEVESFSQMPEGISWPITVRSHIRFFQK